MKTIARTLFHLVTDHVDVPGCRQRRTQEESPLHHHRTTGQLPIRTHLRAGVSTPDEQPTEPGPLGHIHSRD